MEAEKRSPRQWAIDILNPLQPLSLIGFRVIKGYAGGKYCHLNTSGTMAKMSEMSKCFANVSKSKGLKLLRIVRYRLKKFRNTFFIIYFLIPNG